MTKKGFNLRNMVAIATCLAGFTVFTGCNKDNNPNDPNPNGDSNNDFENLGYVAPEKETDPHVFVNMKDGSSFAFYTNAETGNVKSAICDDGSKTALIRYGVDGLPIGAYSENRYYIFLYAGNTITTEIYDADGQKIDEQTIQGEDIAELTTDSPYLRSAAPFNFSECVTKVFEHRTAKATKRVNIIRGFSDGVVEMFDYWEKNPISKICPDSDLRENINNNKSYDTRSVLNRVNGKLGELLREQYKIFDIYRDKLPGMPLNDDPRDRNGYLELSDYEMKFKKEGEGRKLTINTNLRITTISSDQSWCQIYPYDGNQSVNIIVGKNVTSSSRTATILVVASNPITFEITTAKVDIIQLWGDDNENLQISESWFENTAWDITESGETKIVYVDSDGTTTDIYPYNNSYVAYFSSTYSGSDSGIGGDEKPTYRVTSPGTLVEESEYKFDLTTTTTVTGKYTRTYSLASVNAQTINVEIQGNWVIESTEDGKMTMTVTTGQGIGTRR